MGGRGRGRGSIHSVPVSPPSVQPSATEVTPTPAGVVPAAPGSSSQGPGVVQTVEVGLAGVSIGRGRGRGRGVVPGSIPGIQQPLPAGTSALSTAAGIPLSGSGTTGTSAGVSRPQPGLSQPVAQIGQGDNVPPPAAPQPLVPEPAQDPETGNDDNFPTFKGEKGVPVPVMSNFVRIRIPEGRGLHEYVVTFEPLLEETRTRRIAIRALEHALGDARTFDGRKLYLPILLPPVNRILSTFHPNDPTQVLKVTLTLVKVSTENKTQFYNVLMRKIMVALNYTEINRDFYNPAKMSYLAQHNLEIWPGYVTSIENYEGGLMLCLNSTTRVMRRETILEMLKNLKQRNPSSYKKDFEELIVKKSIITRYNNKHYKVDDVNWEDNPMTTFERNGGMITFVDYFSNQHGTKIYDLTQPLLVSRVRRSKNDPRGEFYYVSLVPELCNQSGLTDDIRSNHNLMRELIGFSRATPSQRHVAIMDFLRSIRACPEAMELVNKWGLEFDTECLIDKGRGLPGPTLQFKNFTLKAAPADFTKAATDKQCHLAVPLKNFQVYCTSQDKDKADKMLQLYKQVSPILGIPFGPNPEIIILAGRTGRGLPTAADIRQALRTNAIPEKVQFVIVILPIAKDDLYASVKRYCLTETSLPSQVILAKTLNQDRKLRAVMQKVALQINCKLGGSLWTLNIPLKDLIMFVGIDTHHDPSRKKKSVMSLVASLDNYCTQYYSRIVNQSAHQESSDAIRPVFVQALQVFYEVNHRYPDRIVVYRDGVGDGMLENVKNVEVAALKAEAKKFCEENLKFLFVIVQKRINERLFLLTHQLDNPPPGTIMDHTITRRGLYDFFLVSQLVRQGTVAPTHYIVLEDSGENKPDLVQRLSYVTSYMYYNWPGAVRVPAMCQYAHKLAMLAGQHLNADPLDNMDRQLFYL